jgi:pimeloyl-ACP methyl ester carboxylesterase
MSRGEERSGGDAAAPFRAEVPQATLDRIRERVRAYDWSAMLALQGWDLGTDVGFLRGLGEYWADGYDWRAAERAMNRFYHFIADVGGQGLHFIHERGSGNSPQPLLLLHGWPYSFHTFMDVIEPLAHPERSGGDAERSFDVVVASLPGYGFSDKPEAPMGPRRMGDLLDRLMVEALGYDRYLVQGGDWGGYIASRMGFDHPEHVKGIHSNSFMVRHDGAPLGSGQAGPDATEEERAFVQREQQTFALEGGYSIIQGTRPQSLSPAMADSPVGAAAWVLEKFHGWSDGRGRSFDEIFPWDRLLTEVMVYLVTGTFATAAWIYAAFMPEGSATFPPGQRVEVPTAFAAYPDPVFPAPPRSFMERSHNVVQWTEMPRGGHFPALEGPDLFVEDVRRFGRLVR